MARGDVGLIFNDDEGRILEVTVADMFGVDATDHVLGGMGEPDLFGRRVPDVREPLRRAMEAARHPDPSLGTSAKTSYRLADGARTRHGWYRTGGDMLEHAYDMVWSSVGDGVGVCKRDGGDEWNM